MRIWLSLLLGLLFATTAMAAAPMPAVNEPHPVYNEKRNFNFCLAEYIYADQRHLSIALSPLDEINLGLTIPKGGFKTTASYQLKLELDKNAPRTVKAHALDGNTLLMQFGKDAALIKQMSGSDTLTVTGGKTQMNFALPNIELQFTKLRECNRTHQPSTATASSPEPAPTASNTFPAPLMQLLSNAGLKNIKPLNLENVPHDSLPADYIWENGALVGGVKEQLVPKGATLDDIMGLHLQGLNQQCGGAFNSSIDKTEIAPQLTLRAAMVECAADNEPKIIVGLLFYITSSGHFTVFTHEGTADQEAAIVKAQQSIHDAVIRLAQQTAQPAKK